MSFEDILLFFKGKLIFSTHARYATATESNLFFRKIRQNIKIIIWYDTMKL